ncbi:methyl-accepting chemotaxis protein [Chromatiaceae bacterium AAb-1]|nr:methyl-accepting chemotaxis protein [Chromatiaceae bacterium AAb-1]
METLSAIWRTIGFGGRLTVVMVSLLLASILILSSLLFVEYKQSHTNAVINTLETTGQLSAEAFTEWLLVRQDEMRYLAQTDAAITGDLSQLAGLLLGIARSQGNYDTIFLVSPYGRGLVGVSYQNEQAQLLSESEAAAFDVADRDWFQQAISGKPVFSQPVISRATGSQVSTVAIPVIHNNQVVAVMRGAVQLSTIFKKVSELSRNDYTEVYLLDSSGKAITPAHSVHDKERPLQTKAADGIRAKRSATGQYLNAAGVAVVGSYSYMPMLGWGLVLESDAEVVLSDVREMLWMLVITSAVVLVIAVLVCMRLVSSVTRMLGGEPDYTADIVHKVAEGDLTTFINLKEGDSASLLASVSGMQTSLRQIIGQVSSYAEQVAAAATELSQINEQTRAGIESQNSEINSSAVAMNEMTTSLEEVSQNTQQAAEAASAADKQTMHGQTIVSGTVQDLETLGQEVSRAAEIIHNLKQDSDRIGNILQVIESIAEQTNLLALNAAIEAARAGESGRGFAVVADEVRTLASRTKDSTTEIQQMIEKLQTGTDNAVKATLKSEQTTRNTAERAAQAGTALHSIRSAVSLINDTAHQIASATEQQTVVSRDINRNLHQISDVAYQTGENMVQSALASDSLAKLAEQLKSLVRIFKV